MMVHRDRHDGYPRAEMLVVISRDDDVWDAICYRPHAASQGKTATQALASLGETVDRLVDGVLVDTTPEVQTRR